MERLASEGQLMAYRHEDFWQCMDTLRDLRLLESLWTSGKAPGRHGRFDLNKSILTPVSADLAVTNRPLIICASFTETSWKWFAPTFAKTDWEFFYSNRRNWLDRTIRRSTLPMLRACWESVCAADRGHASLLFPHRTWDHGSLAMGMRIRRVRTPHVAWSFNFSILPRGLAHRLMTSAFKDVDRFIVHSTTERDIYADYFDIDPERIDVVLWGVNKPEVASPAKSLQEGDYICALGSNARDYKTLFAAMKCIPEITLHAVLRPSNITGLEIPPNVQLHMNIHRGQANNILAHSRFMVLPLADATIPCGHVTLVAAMYLKKAMIITDSSGVADYVQDGVNSLLVPPGDAGTLAMRIRELWTDPRRAERLGLNGLTFATANCSEQQVIDHLKLILMKYGLPV